MKIFPCAFDRIWKWNIFFIIILSGYILLNSSNLFNMNCSTTHKIALEMDQNIEKVQFDKNLFQKMKEIQSPFAPCLSEPPWIIPLSGHVVMSRKSLIITVYHEAHSNWIQSPWKEKINLKNPTTLDLWCIFQDGSMSVIVHGEVNPGWTENARYFDCDLTPSAEFLYIKQGYLNSTIYDKGSNQPLAQLHSVPTFPLNQIKNNITICGPPIFNVPPHFSEWAEYHKLIGVNHIALYICHPIEDFWAHPIMKFYVNEGFLSLIEWCPPQIRDRDRSTQNVVYVDCMYRFMDSTRWLMIHDLDEFMYPVEQDSLLPILSKHGKINVAGLRVQSIWFGPCSEKRQFLP